MTKNKATGPVEQIELGIQTTIKLNELDVSEHNARKHGVELDPELVASIESLGLLQPLIAYFNPKTGRGQVCGGQRRLLALQELAKQGKLAPDTLIPVRHMAQDDAIEASMAENLERKDMSLGDEFEAFRSLIQTGRYDADLIAKRFGYTPTYVKRRLRLAELAPEILEAVDAGKIGIDGAMAYAAMETPEQQLKVFKKEERNNWRPHSVENIKQHLRNDTMTKGSYILAYAGGMKAYLKAGGREPGSGLFDELLGTEDILPDPDIAIGLAQVKLDKAAAKLAKELAKEEPLVSGVVTCAIGTDKAKAPDGFGLYDLGYGDGIDKVIAKVVKAGGRMYRILSLHHSTEPSLSNRKLFVSKDVLAKVKPKDTRSTYEPYVPPTPEEREAQRREHGINAFALKLAVRDLPLERIWELAEVRAWGSRVELAIQVSDETREKYIAAATVQWEEAETERLRIEAEQEAERATAAKTSYGASVASIELLDELSQFADAGARPVFVELKLEAGDETLTITPTPDGEFNFINPDGETETIAWPVVDDMLRDYILGYAGQDIAPILSVIREDTPTETEPDAADEVLAE